MSKRFKEMSLDNVTLATYRDDAAFSFIMDEFNRKDVSLTNMAHEAYIGQVRFNDTLNEEMAQKALFEIMHKREIKNNIMIALAIDKLAESNLLPEPLQGIIVEDAPNFGTDEILGMAIASLYGSVAMAQFGYLDLAKDGEAKRLDKTDKGVNTMIDDIVSGIIAATEAKIMQNLVKEPEDK